MSKVEKIPNVCTICGSELWHTNAIDECGLYAVFCKNLKCRWAEVYDFNEKKGNTVGNKV